MGFEKLITLGLLLTIVPFTKCQYDQNSNDSGIRKLLENVQVENAKLRKQVEILIQRDVETDVAEMKRTISAHTEDITNLRINQGFILEADTKQETQLLDHSELLNSHQLFLDSHSASILNHENLLTSHTAQIQFNQDGVNSNALKIEEDRANINKNIADISTVTESFGGFQASLIRFHVESPCCQGSATWPDNSRITFENKLVDTHNAHDGFYFAAPISGFYGFIFTADIRIYEERPDPALIYVRVNDVIVKTYLFDMNYDRSSDHPSSLYFGLRINQGDRLDLGTSNYPAFDISRNGASLFGFLLQKN